MEQDPPKTERKSSYAETFRGKHPDLADRKGMEPLVDNAEGFILELSANGEKLGWLGKDAGGWAILVSDIRQALALERYPHEGKTYYRIKGSNQYLSVTLPYVGFFYWIGAAAWQEVDGNLVWTEQNQKLSLQAGEDRYICAWNDYETLSVAFQAIPKPDITDPPLTEAIEHIVVVMLENRSFDNVLGGLYPDKTQKGLYQGLTGEETNPLDPANPGKGSVKVFQGANRKRTWTMPYPDPGELFQDMNEQIFGMPHPASDAPPKMNGFAANYAKQECAPRWRWGCLFQWMLRWKSVAQWLCNFFSRPRARNIMQYYHEDAVPMSSYLARNYAVCDNWYAAGPVQTLANRIFTHCGTPGLVPGTNKARLNNPDFFAGWEDHWPPVTNKTVFELLDDSYPNEEINWKVYYHDAPISVLCDYVYDRWDMDSWDGGNVFHFHELEADQTNFEYDIRHNRLPKYSFIEPRYTDLFGGTVNSSHPGGAGVDFLDPNGSSLPPPISVRHGEHLLSEVYGILSKYPDTFNKTLLVVIYDEHGGLYDHVAPGAAVSPFEKKPDNFPYDRHGVRIPAILVNPLIAPGTIYPPREAPGEHHESGPAPEHGPDPEHGKTPSLTAFDHTSLISTLCKQFGLSGSLTPRSDAAPRLEGLIKPGAKPQVRPAPPVFAGASEIRHDNFSAIGNIDIAHARQTVLGADPALPLSLAHALAPFHGMSQKRRLNPGKDKPPQNGESQGKS